MVCACNLDDNLWTQVSELKTLILHKQVALCVIWIGVLRKLNMRN